MDKICGRCKINKPISEFGYRDSKKIKLKAYCKSCAKIYKKEYYTANRKFIIERSIKQNKKRYDDLKVWFFNYLLDKKCIDCGESNPVVLEFDHVRGEKENNISVLIHKRTTTKKILEEINKCEIRCSNCHKIKTAKEYNWYKNIPNISKYLK